MNYFLNLFRNTNFNKTNKIKLHPSSFNDIPFAEIEKVGDKILLHGNTFHVDWVLGAFCNYKCSYCFPETHSSVPDGHPIEVLIKTVDEIKKQARERGCDSFIFAFSGGEPSISKGYLDLIRCISNDSFNCKSQAVYMTTNLSPGFKWLEKWDQATAPLQKRHITASFHSEFAKKEVFVNKVLFLRERGIPISINMVMVPERFETLWEDALYFHSKNININLIPQRNGHELVSGWTDSMKKRLKEGLPNKKALLSISDEQSKKQSFKKETSITSDDCDMELTDSTGKIYYVDLGERLNILNFNKFKGWECLAGHRSLIIDKNGYVKRGHTCHMETLGHIETGFKLFPEVKACITKSSCSCGRDIMIPKRKQGSSLPL